MESIVVNRRESAIPATAIIGMVASLIFSQLQIVREKYHFTSSLGLKARIAIACPSSCMGEVIKQVRIMMTKNGKGDLTKNTESARRLSIKLLYGKKSCQNVSGMLFKKR